MTQLTSVLISFLLIPILTRKKVKLSYTLLITAAILGLISGIGFEALGRSIMNVFTNSSSRTTILTVMMVSILGGLMKYYNILDKIVETLLLLIRDKKKILMITPAMIGVLIIPGGALLSAPFINDLGKGMKLTPPRRAAINLVFRHIAMFMLPYSTSLLLVSAILPDLNIFRLIFLNLFFVIVIIILGYFFFLKDVETNISSTRENIKHNLYKLAIYTSPIYVAVLINAITGLPFYVTLIASVFIVYLIGNKDNFAKITYRSLNWNTVLTVTAILILKEIILNLEDLIRLFTNMLNGSGGILSVIVVFFISAFFFGYITGNHTASLAIILPMVSKLNIEGGLLYVYTFFVFGSAFLGYFLSPLHLCQAFTLEHMKVSTGELYKEYRFYIPSLIVLLVIFVFVFRFIL